MKALTLVAFVCLAACGSPETAKAPASLAVSKQHLAGEYNKGTDDGPGYHGEGGPVDGPGVYGIGGGDGPGMVGVGAGFDGSGVVGQGSGYGSGGIFAGGSHGPGVYAYAGTPSTAADRRAAIVANGGHLEFQTVIEADASAPVTNAITPELTPKAWAVMQMAGSGSGAVYVLKGANVEFASAADGNLLRVHLASNTVGPCAAIATGGSWGHVLHATCDNGTVTIGGIDVGSAPLGNGAFPSIDFSDAGPVRVSVVVYGIQRSS